MATLVERRPHLLYGIGAAILAIVFGWILIARLQRPPPAESGGNVPGGGATTLPGPLENREPTSQASDSRQRISAPLPAAAESSGGAPSARPPDTVENIANIIDQGTANEHVETGCIRNGKREGQWKVYQPDGTLWMEKEYADGKLNGITRLWGAYSNIEQERTYRDGKLNGSLTAWNPDGTEAFRHEYVDGLREGAWYERYPTGGLKSRGQCKNDKLDGFCEFYHPGGLVDVERTGTYVAGKRMSGN